MFWTSQIELNSFFDSIDLCNFVDWSNLWSSEIGLYKMPISKQEFSKQELQLSLCSGLFKKGTNLNFLPKLFSSFLQDPIIPQWHFTSNLTWNIFLNWKSYKILWFCWYYQSGLEVSFLHLSRKKSSVHQLCIKSVWYSLYQLNEALFGWENSKHIRKSYEPHFQTWLNSSSFFRTNLNTDFVLP